jgi:hypothetical protein
MDINSFGESSVSAQFQLTRSFSGTNYEGCLYTIYSLFLPHPFTPAPSPKEDKMAAKNGVLIRWIVRVVLPISNTVCYK